MVLSRVSVGSNGDANSLRIARAARLIGVLLAGLILAAAALLCGALLLNRVPLSTPFALECW